MAMAFKRALVVDDSKSARMALKGLLEQQELQVYLAETGEDAIEFLKTQAVDVIFMDHSMPGMTGLEAVSVIKGNPRTAMIPVMMYTAKEGEVYVGQARALGAVGVLPKQVQPGALFDMLLKLGLVRDRRAEQRPEAPEAPARPAAEIHDEVDRQYEQQALGMSVQALVTRILEGQHTVLRLDILSSHRSFAKQVAAEIFQKQKAEEELAKLAPPPKKTYSRGAFLLLTLALLVPALVLLGMVWQLKGERDAALSDSSRLADAAQRQLAAAQTETTDLISDIETERGQARLRYLAGLNALEWAVNRDGGVPFYEPALNDTRRETLEALLVHARAMGFQGTVRLESHLGEFCLVPDDRGGLRLPDPDMPLSQCVVFGHPLDDSDSAVDRQAVGFANFLATSPLVNGSGIEVQVIAHSRADSSRRYPFPANLQTAGEWNHIAELNNRIEYSLIPVSR